MTASRPLLVQQMLHGYEDGHRLLVSSTRLSQPEMKTVLQMSDSSGPGLRSDADAYLTGYPLPQSGCYALARTWPAPEMPRPGCVWTHTLLIDFADLAILGDFSALPSYFVRPGGGRNSSYSTILEIDAGERRDTSPWDPQRARQALAGLYETPESRVLLTRSESDLLDGLVLSIWAQQWPRLRRSFRFCTNASTDRSTDTNPFDLQLVGSSPSALRSRFPKGQIAQIPDQPGPVWLELAVRDLLIPNGDGLRQFLHSIGGDVDEGREAFPYLAQLHADLLTLDGNFSALSNAIDLLTNKLARVEAAAIRASVVRSAARHVSALDDNGVRFLTSHLELVDLGSPETAKVGRDLLERSPIFLLELLRAEGPRRLIAEEAIRTSPLELVLDFAEHHVGVIDSVLELRDDWMLSSAFWKRKSIMSEAVVRMAASGTSDAGSILIAIIDADRPDLISTALSAFGSRLVLESVIQLADNRGIDRHLGAWLGEATRDISALTHALVNATSSSPVTLAAIARQVQPDTVANDYGEDPWLTATRGASPSPKDLYLLSFLLARALGHRSSNQAELAILGFAAIHEATAAGRLGDDCWSLLSPRLPRSFFGYDWDRCWRLRAGLVDLFVQRRLPASVFASAAFGDELFNALAHWAKRSPNGEEFLWHVHDTLRSTGSVRRSKALEELIRGS